MPLNLFHLESRLLDQIAPGNPTEFRRILTEADQRLLESGRWSWVRTRTTLVPVDGKVLLPKGYKSIVGCKMGDVAREVTWEEAEFMEDRPSSIHIDGCKSRLEDDGLISLPDGNMLVEGGDPEIYGTLLHAGIYNGRSCYSTDGVQPPILTDDQWVFLSWNTGLSRWEASLYEDKVVIGTWYSSSDVETPDLATGWTAFLGSGVISVAASTSSQRVYSVVGDFTGTITALVRYDAKELDGIHDSPRCQSFSALKYMMLAIVYEESNDLERAVGYSQMAVDILNKEESAHRGTAKRIFKPQQQGARLRRGMPTNFS